MRLRNALLILSIYVTWLNGGALGMHFEIPSGHVIFATSEESALHEVGHLVYEFSFEFIETVELYLEDEHSGELYDYMIDNYPDNIEEIYAELYMWDKLYSIPQEFEEFF